MLAGAAGELFGASALLILAPSSLPEIDFAEVVSIRAINPNRVDDYMVAAEHARRVRVFGAEAQQIAGLWRALPEGEQTRCHLPPFGLRFFSAGKLVCEASICWKCNNIFGRAGADRFFFAFDGSHPSSRLLLTACETVLGETAEE